MRRPPRLAILASIAMVGIPLGMALAGNVPQGTVPVKDAHVAGTVRTRLAQKIDAFGYARWATLKGIGKYRDRRGATTYRIRIAIDPGFVSGTGWIDGVGPYLAKITLAASDLLGAEPDSIWIDLGSDMLCDDTYHATELISYGGCNGSFRKALSLTGHVEHAEGRLRPGAGLSLARKAAAKSLGAVASEVRVSETDGYLVLRASGLKAGPGGDGGALREASFFVFRPTRSRDERMDGSVTLTYRDEYSIVADDRSPADGKDDRGKSLAAIRAKELEGLVARLNEAIASANR